MNDETQDRRRAAVVDAICGPLGSPTANAYLNDADFHAWLDGRVEELLWLTDQSVTRSEVNQALRQRAARDLARFPLSGVPRTIQP